jgi:hypothetical protein
MTVEEQEVFVVLCSVSGAMSMCLGVPQEVLLFRAYLPEIPVNRQGALVAWW